MPLCDLSVSELARTTGLALDAAWTSATVVTERARISVWCAPEWQADALLSAAPSSLPPAGALRVEFRRGEAAWNAEWPMSFDMHWLREITPGFPLGTRPVRALPSLALQAGVHLQGGFVTLVWRDANGQTRVQVALSAGDTAPVIKLETGTHRLPESATAMDEVLRALTGSTAIEWLRSVFSDSCSSRWSGLAERIGARPDQLDDLALYFRALTTTEEDALWRAAASAGLLAELCSWLEVFVSEPACVIEARLREELRRKGPAFWRGSMGEWLNAVAGGTMARFAAPRMAGRLAASATKIQWLLTRRDLARLLVRLRAAADEDWAVLAPWYRSRIEESCGALSPDLRPDRVADEVNLWMRKLHQRLHQSAVEVARQRAQAALSAAVASTDSNLGAATALADLAIGSGPKGDEIVDRVLGGDLRPCLDSGQDASQGDVLNQFHGRRIAIEILLPYFQKQLWMRERENLAAAEIIQTGDGQLTVTRNGWTENWSAPLERAELLLSAVFASRAEAPADDTLHMVHEDRRALQGNESDVAWLRLIRAYGLTPPRLPAGSCEATLRVEIPWNWAEEWCRVPLTRDAGSVDRFIRLSLAMQEMARHWLPALCLRSPEQFEAPKEVLPLLVYAASQPHANRRRAEYGYDAMSPFRVERAALSAASRLPELLDPIYRSLKASGHPETAELYSPDRARLIVAAVRKRPRLFTALLAGDTFFLEHCFQITTLSRELLSVAGRNPARALRKLAQSSEEIVKTSLRGVKRHYPSEAYHGLGSLYLLEATRALSEGAEGFRASLTVETGTGVQRLEAAA